MKQIKDNINEIIFIGILLPKLFDEPWNLFFRWLILTPCAVYLVWDFIENRNKRK